MFIIARKVKGKWYGLASTTGTCCAHAFDKFIEAGFPNQYKERDITVTWDDIEKQKNYAGRVPEFREV